MARDIRPTSADDLLDLSRFLTTGFHAPAGADYAAPEILRWKYLELAEPGGGRRDDNDAGDAEPVGPRSYIARDETGEIIGHLGLCRTAFEGRALAAHGERISTIHIIDWLGSPEHRAVGTSLMRKAHEGVATQFGLGVSPSALVVGERIGYELRALVPVYTRVLRPGYWMRSRESDALSRGLRLIRDSARQLIRRQAALRSVVNLKQVSRFGSEIDPIAEQAHAHAITTCRDAARLNMMLDFPRQAMTGWHLIDETGRLRGLAMLNIIPKEEGRTRTGKIVDCLLDDCNIDRWQAAFLALTRELLSQGADLAQAYASTPWTAEALGQSGYQSKFAVKFHIRDRLSLIPREATFHLTPLEGDYAYT